MKKALTVILSALLVVAVFASCGADTEKWDSSVNDTFKDVAVYTYGDTISADFENNCNVKINDDNYDHFVKYIEKLKASGFEYVKNGDTPENYSLSNGQASWRCTNGKVYLQLIFNSSDSANFDMFGCNVQIYGYNQKPTSWGSESKKSSKKKSSSKTSETTASPSEEAAN